MKFLSEDIFRCERCKLDWKKAFRATNTNICKFCDYLNEREEYARNKKKVRKSQPDIVGI